MSEQLQYYYHGQKFDPSYQHEIFNGANEAHELATDVQHIGSVALFSEVQTGNVIGHPIEVSVPNPLTTFSEGRTFSSFYGKGKERHKRVTKTLSEADVSLKGLELGLNGYGASSSTIGSLESVAPESRGIGVLRDLHDVNGNVGMILEGANVPPYIKTAKDLAAAQQGKEASAFSWEDYFKTGSDEQLTNFAQAYTERIKLLASPTEKAKLIETIKSDYMSRVKNAMAEGWIDGKYKAELDRRIKHTELLFFSPFGDMPQHTGGLRQRQGKDIDIVLLPTIAGKQMTVHELGHVFAGVDAEGMVDYFVDRLGKKEVQRKGARLRHLYEIVNEGYNGHMTVALIDGEPTLVRPSDRKDKGIAEEPGASEIYRSYREIFGTLIGGEAGEIKDSDINQVVDSMVTGNFTIFRHLLDQKWGGRDVLSEVFDVICY